MLNEFALQALGLPALPQLTEAADNNITGVFNWQALGVWEVEPPREVAIAIMTTT